MQAVLVQKTGAIKVDYTPVSDKVAGEVVVMGAGVGFVHRGIPAGGQGSISQQLGVYDVVKAVGAIAQWANLYWNPTGDPVGGSAGTGAITTSAAGNTFAGVALLAAGASDPTVRVYHVASTSVTNTPLSNVIADPGNAGAIPVTQSGYVPIVTAGSETRTLAIPTFIGQELLLYIKTDGGTAVITVASAINQTGNNTITMADVRDVIRLVAIESGSNKVWHVVSNDGAALSTV